MSATARAHSNIALIKYWGKRDAALNLPAVGSISITLDALYTDTQVCFDPALSADHCELDGRDADNTRISRFLDLVRTHAGIDQHAHVVTHNNFPTGAGLASSASGFAALALAASAAAGLDLDTRALSLLARQGSGSAARSIFGGYAQMQRGTRADGKDAHASPLLDAQAWPLSVIVAVTRSEPKNIDSTRGMTGTAASSPFYASWVDAAHADLAAMRDAIETRDFHALGTLAEHSCLKLHALMLSTQPGLIYWNAATVATMHALRALRRDGVPVYFTIDAGPQVKALCPPAYADTVATALNTVAGVERVIPTQLGPGAHMLS